MPRQTDDEMDMTVRQIYQWTDIPASADKKDKQGIYL